MKTIILATVLLFTTQVFGQDKAAAPAVPASAPKYKEVCKEKDGKKTCKKVRIHKKLDGKPVPQK